MAFFDELEKQKERFADGMWKVLVEATQSATEQCFKPGPVRDPELADVSKCSQKRFSLREQLDHGGKR